MNDDAGPIDKLTDTHWNAKEGTAEFNWRVIYKVRPFFVILDHITNRFSCTLYQFTQQE